MPATEIRAASASNHRPAIAARENRDNPEQDLLAASAAWGLAVITLFAALAGCSVVQDTPRQAYVRDLGYICDGQSPFWKMQRVASDGRYSIWGENSPGRDEYMRCMETQFATTPYRKWLAEHPGSTATANPGSPSSGQSASNFAFDPSLGAFALEHKSLVRYAFFTVGQPTGRVSSSSLPAVSTTFKVGQEVIFFLVLDKSGQPLAGKFRWLRPDGTLEAEQNRSLPEGDGFGRWTWYTQILPGPRLQVSGKWAVEAYLNSQLIGQYEFTAVAQ